MTLASSAESSPEAVRQAVELLHPHVTADWLAEVTGGGVPQVTQAMRGLEVEAGG